MKTEMDAAAGPGRSADFTDQALGNPDLLLNLPDIAAQRIAKYLSNKDFSSLGQVSKETNIRTGKFAPTADKCIKRSADQLEEISVEYLANRLFYNSAVLFEARAMRSNVREKVKMIKEARKADGIAKEILREKLFLLCKETVGRSKGRGKDVLTKYFLASKLDALQAGAGDILFDNEGPRNQLDNGTPLDDGIEYRSYEVFKATCKVQVEMVQFLNNLLVYPRVKQWYANITCAFLLIRYPGGPRAFKETLKEQGPASNPEFLQLLELFRSMGATKDGLQAIWDKAFPAVRKTEKTWEGRIFSKGAYPYSSEFSEDPMSVVKEYFGEYMREWS